MLHMFGLEGFFEQGVFPQVDHTNGQIVTGAPEALQRLQLFTLQGGILDSGPGGTIGAQ